jgi:hypothetical protein
MALLDFLLGKPLASGVEREEQHGNLSRVLHALGSAAYRPEAALTILIPLAASGTRYIVPISIAIIVLVGMVYFPIGRRLPPIRVVAAPTLSPHKIWAPLPDYWQDLRAK